MLPKQIRTEKLDRDFFSDGEGVTCMLRQGDSLVVAGQRGLYRFTPDARLKYSGYMMGVSSLAEHDGRRRQRRARHYRVGENGAPLRSAGQKAGGGRKRGVRPDGKRAVSV